MPIHACVHSQSPSIVHFHYNEASILSRDRKRNKKKRKTRERSAIAVCPRRSRALHYSYRLVVIKNEKGCVMRAVSDASMGYARTNCPFRQLAIGTSCLLTFVINRVVSPIFDILTEIASYNLFFLFLSFRCFDRPEFGKERVQKTKKGNVRLDQTRVSMLHRRGYQLSVLA